jgi:hypothetical protein
LGTRHSPRPLIFRRANELAKLGRERRRDKVIACRQFSAMIATGIESLTFDGDRLGGLRGPGRQPSGQRPKLPHPGPFSPARLWR